MLVFTGHQYCEWFVSKSIFRKLCSVVQGYPQMIAVIFVAIHYVEKPTFRLKFVHFFIRVIVPTYT